MGIFAQLRGAALGGPLGRLLGAAPAGPAAAPAGPAAALAHGAARPVAFTIAAIALAAKMARADGIATEAEFARFERLFRVERAERANAARFYRLAKASTAGFEAYAAQAARLLGPGTPALEDLLDALLAIAEVDGFRPEELAYFDAVAAQLGFTPAQAAAIRARCRLCAHSQPHAVLGLAPGASLEAIRDAYRRLARTHHPDRHLADGVPPEFIRLAEARMAAINAAYAALSARPAAPAAATP